MSNPFLEYDSNNYGDKQTQLQDIRNKTIESQKNAIRSIAQSEQVGINTAVELMDQGEKLDRTNQRLDEINEKQKISEKHIKNLNTGFFGGIVGLFKKKEAPVVTESSKDKVYDTYRNPELDKMTTSYKSSPVQVQNANTSDGVYREEFNRNLDDMSHGVSRLNNLAKGLGAELDRQNQLLDEMTPKTDKINTTMTNQNKQLKVLLYGKAK